MCIRDRVYRLNKDFQSKENEKFEKESSYYVPLDQPQFRLIKSMFYTNTEFKDSLFYDVSAWNMPMAFNLNLAFSKNIKSNNEPLDLNATEEIVAFQSSNYGYLLHWEDYYAPMALNKILDKGIRAKTALKPFVSDGKGYARGTIFVPVQNQSLNSEAISSFLQQVVTESGVKITPVFTGSTSTGIDLGSPNFELVRKPKVLMIIGSRVSPYGAGEVWHLLDQRFGMSVTKVDFDKFNSMNLSKYNTLVLPDGNYSKASGKIKKFVETGGTLVTIGRGTGWLVNSNMTQLKNMKRPKAHPEKNRLPYDQRVGDRRKHAIGGAIIEGLLDLTHPLAFGYQDMNLPLWKNNNNILEIPNNKYSTVIQYKNQPLLSGYMSNENQQNLGGKAALVTTNLGRGRVVAFAENPLFRAYWYGTNKLFMNALFFGNLIDVNASSEDESHGHGH